MVQPTGFADWRDFAEVGWFDRPPVRRILGEGEVGPITVASVYGAAGSLVVILLWIYYSGQIVYVFGAEFTKVYSRRFGAVVVPDPTAVTLTTDARAAQGMDHSKTIARRKARAKDSRFRKPLGPPREQGASGAVDQGPIGMRAAGD